MPRKRIFTEQQRKGVITHLGYELKMMIETNNRLQDQSLNDVATRNALLESHLVQAIYQGSLSKPAQALDERGW